MLKRYDIKSSRETHEGWAVIVIDTDIGYFSTVSDFGNYAYIWSSPGCEFRKFLLDVETDYLAGKLLHGRRDAKVFDGNETKKTILAAIEEKNDSYKERDKHWHAYAEEKRQVEALFFANKEDFEEWQSETTLDEPWALGCWMRDPQCTAFCEKVFPRFQALLKTELAEEAAAAVHAVTDERETRGDQ